MLFLSYLFRCKVYFDPVTAVANRSTLSSVFTPSLCQVQTFVFWPNSTKFHTKKKKGACLSAPVLSLRQTPFLLLNSFRALLRYFSVNQSSGELTLRQDTPPGSYWLRVGVSDGVWPDVISGVRVHVRDLEEKAILTSASLRLTGNV